MNDQKQNWLGVLVFAEQDEARLADVSLELLSKARELADKLGKKVGAALLGHNVGSLAAPLIAHGADVVFAADSPGLKTYTTLPYAKAVSDIIEANEPEIVMFGASLIGRDLAPRVAARLRTGLTADCTDLQIGDYSDKRGSYTNLLLQIRPAFGGNIIATIVTPDHRPQMATVREGVMPMKPADASRKGEVRPVCAQLDGLENVVRIIERFKAEKKVNLKAAQIIVAGGAGVASKEGFDLIRELAHVLGGQVGASRAAVDAGFIGKEHQVGQTGLTVRPKVYVACGISGQVQHRAGMQEASKIIAVNSDAAAPIFSVAHYGIVGDLFQVIPLMIEAYKQK
ncbi:MAG TPA: electron transfer flavoprotein subunit alpha/FixB family protein [Planctomycetota bacterium]|nr:electron transfer flavoprotein subunit alpha/FixB family protein [Planctomycetota bacterium]